MDSCIPPSALQARAALTGDEARATCHRGCSLSSRQSRMPSGVGTTLHPGKRECCRKFLIWNNFKCAKKTLSNFMLNNYENCNDEGLLIAILIGGNFFRK